MSRPIAFFDFDGTLTYSDTLIPFLRMLRGLPQLSLDLLKVSPWLTGYALHLVQNDKAKQILLKQSLGTHKITALNDYGSRFAKQHLPDMIRPDVFELLRTHQRNGDCCVLVSASLNIYLEPWINDNDLDFCLSSSLETNSEDQVTGKLLGGNCYGDEKVKRIKNLIQEIGTPSKTYAYGNSKGDIPMLNFVDEGYWVDDKITRFTG
ncbi:MAG: HAD-IB family hydrolase [Methylococcales bacterium]